ncbi:MAG: phosphoglycolate phosphatase [Ahrensia sp.]|nr:phosphoglycolate phosphatase [Ahrensia sp.]|tara:strand:+ start:5224 stop:5928 length:705 start_codon:yes stop_codon:yes gene_type:complete
MKPPIIVFDLDGTLVDTAPDLLTSMNHALSHVGLGPIADDGFRKHVGFGARIMLERAYEESGHAHPGKETLDELMRRFLAYYEDTMPGASRPYDHVLEAIAALEAEGYIAAVCTNKLEAYATRLLKALGIDGIFKAICGQDTFPVRKPDPAHLTGTIDMAGGDPRRAIMVGDSETDILTAKSASIPVVAVDFGYTDRHVSEFGPDAVISDYRALDLALARKLHRAGKSGPVFQR